MPIIKDKEIARMIQDGELMLVNNAAKVFGLSPNTIRSWIYHKVISYYKVSPRYTYVYTQQIREKLLVYNPRNIKRQETLNFENA